MSGLLALLDDVAAMAKLAAAQLDDVALQATKAGTKAAGVVIDDAAVTPKYVTGLPAARELPIVLKIARGSLFNKLVILLPAALVLNAFASWSLTPLLMLGGCYLCFEGAEKILRTLTGHVETKRKTPKSLDAAHLEEQQVKRAIKTDFILSAEIMAISLSAIDTTVIWQEAVILAAIAIVITLAVYGVVALIVKADDFGLYLTQKGRPALTRQLGVGIVKIVPYVLQLLTVVGTAAMLWVGGNILVHGMHDLGFRPPEEMIKGAANAAASAAGFAVGLIEWVVIAFLDGVLGLCVGLLIAKALHLFSRDKASAPA